MTASTTARCILASALSISLLATGAVAAQATQSVANATSATGPTDAPAIYIWNGDGDDAASTKLQETVGTVFTADAQLVLSASTTDVNAEITATDYVPAGQTATKVYRFVAPEGKTAKADWTAWDLSDAAGPNGGVLTDNFTLEDHAQGDIDAAITAGGDYWVGLAFTDSNDTVLGTAHRTINLTPGTGNFTVEGADQQEVVEVTGPVPTISAQRYAVGQTVTAKAGAWSPAGVSLSYQWLRNGSRITGATKSTYTLRSTDLGKRLTVSVTGSVEGADPVVKISKPTVAIARGTLVAPRPAISGTVKKGKTIRVKTASWKPAGVKLSYQWLRNGKSISKATKSSYKVTSKDRGKRISVKVTGKLTGYTTVSKVSSSKKAK